MAVFLSTDVTDCTERASKVPIAFRVRRSRFPSFPWSDFPLGVVGVTGWVALIVRPSLVKATEGKLCLLRVNGAGSNLKQFSISNPAVEMLQYTTLIREDVEYADNHDVSWI